ncbi:tetratricopeptide repeat protein [Flavobacteriaceae bacterium]|nr:tetratricopeptide repeat protein [Flavobacteriaceae bacterium]
MSIKKTILLIFIVGFVISCKKKENTKQKNNLFELNETERDSLALKYDKISKYYLQPSEIHRIYKDSALIANPNNVEIRQKLSYSYKKVGQHIKAMEVLNKAVEIDTANGNADVLEYKVWSLLYYYRDYEGVVRDVNLIEKITGKPYNACWGEPCGFHKGQALYKLGRFTEAIETLSKVNLEEEKIGFNPNDNHLIFFYIGRCYSEMNEYEKAIKNYKKSLAAVPEFPEAYYQLALVYIKLNEEKKAVENFKLAKKHLHYSLAEPFVERFDQVFEYMIDSEMKK